MNASHAKQERHSGRWLSYRPGAWRWRRWVPGVTVCRAAGTAEGAPFRSLYPCRCAARGDSTMRHAWLDCAVPHRTLRPTGQGRVRWAIQIPRLFTYLRRSGAVASFGEVLRNIFDPLFEVRADSCSYRPNCHRLHRYAVSPPNRLIARDWLSLLAAPGHSAPRRTSGDSHAAPARRLLRLRRRRERSGPTDCPMCRGHRSRSLPR